MSLRVPEAKKDSAPGRQIVSRAGTAVRRSQDSFFLFGIHEAGTKVA